MDETQNRIVAAVADDDAKPLLHFATDEALRSGSDLHLVHVMTKAARAAGLRRPDGQTRMPARSASSSSTVRPAPHGSWSQVGSASPRSS